MSENCNCFCLQPFLRLCSDNNNDSKNSIQPINDEYNNNTDNNKNNNTDPNTNNHISLVNMPGKWLRKAGRLADKIVDDITDNVTDVIDGIDDKIDLWINMGKQCRSLSSDTKKICQETDTQRQAMIEFASTIQSTLENGLGSNKRDGSNANKPSASDILNTIKELTAGDKVKAAMDIATGVKDVAKLCVDKSVEMSDLIDQGMDQLPKFIQNKIKKDDDDDDDDGDNNNNNNNNNNKSRDIQFGEEDNRSRDIGGDVKKEEEDDDDDLNLVELVKGINNDIKDVESCIHEIQHLNIRTAMKVGLQAFVHLHDKSQKSRELFDSIQKNADDVYTVTHSFTREKMMSRDGIGTIKTVAKSLLRCLRISEAMKEISTLAGKLLNIIVHLFDITAQKISKLWSALAFAKDCMEACIKHVTLTQKSCIQAKDTTVNLIDTSTNVTKKLKSACKLDIQAIRSLKKDGEIQQAIDLAKTIDDDVLECTKEAITMVQKVTEAFKDLPDILTMDIDTSTAGIEDDDPTVPDIEDDVQDMVSSNRELEEADIISAPKASVKGFDILSTKTANKCLDMISMIQDFTSRSDKTIGLFLDVWDFESAVSKINDMHRIVHIGERIKDIANAIKRVIESIIQYMKTTIHKVTHVFPDNVQEKLGDVKDKMEDKLDHVKDKIENKVDHLKDKMKNKFNLF